MFAKTYDPSMVAALQSSGDSGVNASPYRPPTVSLWRDLTRDWSRWSTIERMAAVVVIATSPLILLGASVHALV
jgi:hypothetical protein